jgi:hypothetical protein
MILTAGRILLLFEQTVQFRLLGSGQLEVNRDLRQRERFRCFALVGSGYGKRMDVAGQAENWTVLKLAADPARHFAKSFETCSEAKKCGKDK